MKGCCWVGVVSEKPMTEKKKKRESQPPNQTKDRNCRHTHTSAGRKFAKDFGTPHVIAKITCDM